MPVTEQEWEQLLQKYDHTCLCCGERSGSLTKDHILPRDHGGDDVIENVQPLCIHCNSAKGNLIIDYRGPLKFTGRKTDKNQKWETLEKAVDKLRLSRRTLERQIAAGILPAFVKNGRRYVWCDEEDSLRQSIIKLSELYESQIEVSEKLIKQVEKYESTMLLVLTGLKESPIAKFFFKEEEAD